MVIIDIFTAWECKVMIKWCSTDVGEPTAQAEQKYYLPCFHMCPDCHAQVLEHCWRAFGETPCAFMESPALIPLLSSLFLCFPNHRGSVALSLIPVFWGCPPQSCDKIPSVKGCWQSRAVSTLGRNLVQWEQRSSLKQLMLRCPCLVICGAGFTLKHVCPVSSSWCCLLGLGSRAVGETSKRVVKGTSKGNSHGNNQCCSRSSQQVPSELFCGIWDGCLSFLGSCWKHMETWAVLIVASVTAKVVSESNITDWWICLS